MTEAVTYVSTRGTAPQLGFDDVLLSGLARDGGLYVPDAWPRLGPEVWDLPLDAPYAALAAEVLWPFVSGGCVARADLDRMCDEAYAAFRHPDVVPLVPLDEPSAGDAGTWLLELFHGPTLAFKDVAMQLLGRLMDHALRARGNRATIVGATSGDTGSAAVEAFKGLDQVDTFVLYPHGRVSDVQRRQMTTVASPAVHAIALEGTFDDCQAIVKGMFNHARFRDELRLSGVNSINWARVAAQVVYYFTAAVSLGAPHREVSFSVPTGNFGDVLAGYVAKRMGLPVRVLMVATNVNDILARTIETGTYEIRGVQATASPSMDIQISSNFERLLFDAYGRDAGSVRRLMGGLAQSRAFSVDEEALRAIREDFAARAVDEAEVAAEMSRARAEAGYTIDPHTAVGVRAARELLAADPTIPVVALATAHPAKFPDAVERATGERPPLPPHMADLMTREERFTVLPNDQGAVEAFIRDRSRALRGEAA